MDAGVVFKEDENLSELKFYSEDMVAEKGKEIALAYNSKQQRNAKRRKINKIVDKSNKLATFDNSFNGENGQFASSSDSGSDDSLNGVAMGVKDFQNEIDLDTSIDTQVKTASKVLKRVQCKLCGKPYTNTQSLRQHVSKFHPEEYKKMIKEKVGKPKYQKQVRDFYDDQFECALCGIVYKDTATLYTHQKRYHPGYRQTLMTLHGRKNKKLNEGSETAVSYRMKCQLCPLKFASQDEIDEHQRLHHPEFWTVKEIEREARLKECRCTICGKQYERKKNLEKHMVTHTEEGSKFKCEICGTGVSDAWKLKRHMMKHTGDYPFRCEICDKGFRDEWKYMEEHCKRLHPQIYSDYKAQKLVMNSLNL